MNFPESDNRGLRLFLSVDIAGSTTFKQRHNKGNPEESWVATFTGFFVEFTQLFFTNAEKENSVAYERTELWKALGDELIFSAPVESLAETDALISAFYNTMQEYRKGLRGKQMDLKGTVWTAGFPSRNKLISIPRGKLHDEAEVDYLGPDMDIGFRLGKLATPGPIVASMDLASLYFSSEDKRNMRCYPVGWSSLKGVFSDQPYRIYWLVPSSLQDAKVLSFAPWEMHTSEFAKEWERVQTEPNTMNVSQCHPAWLNEIKDIRKELNDRFGQRLFSPFYWPSSLADGEFPENIDEQIKDEIESPSRHNEVESEDDFRLDTIEATGGNGT